MSDIKGKIKRCVMSLSFQERKKRELVKYKQEIGTLENMSDDELNLQYINIKSQYEHKKNCLSIFMLTIIVSILAEVWKYFYSFVIKVVPFVILNQGNKMEPIIGVITVIMVVFITLLIFILLISNMKKIHRIYKKLLMVEEIRKIPHR